MKQKTVRLTTNVLLGISLLASMACLGGGGEDGSGFLADPEIDGLEPCLVQPGQTLTIYGLRFRATGVVRLNGVEVPTTSWTDNKITLTVPAGATSGPLVVDPDLYGVTSTQMTIGTPVTVPEIEPNDSINGGDATDAGMNHQVTGTLASPADKDHFRFGCLVKNKKYKFKITPRVVGQVFVNGVGFPLDANGEVELYTFSRDTLIIGVTGGTGAYTIDMTLVP